MRFGYCPGSLGSAKLNSSNPLRVAMREAPLPHSGSLSDIRVWPIEPTVLEQRPTAATMTRLDLDESASIGRLGGRS